MHFLEVKIDWSLLKLSEVYVHEIIRLHIIPMYIILDQDPRMRLCFSIIFHSQSNDQPERVI
ncbi:Gag protease polyprotein [Gossypium australe]|uniref:Gag protease polyprotein n=1 Tax=Gossypium australe TaxID=47621 RepID=A0A5B6VBV5_9ROSI|nr:Gag protease polyprotein [Gossypium australe]